MVHEGQVRWREQHRQVWGQRTVREGFNEMRAPGTLSKVGNKETAENGPEGCGPPWQMADAVPESLCWPAGPTQKGAHTCTLLQTLALS